MGLMCYLYKKYQEWADYYRRDNQYGTTLYPRTLDPLPTYTKGCSHSAFGGMSETYPAVVAIAEPLSENTIHLRRKSYKEALLNNLKKV